MKKIISIVLLGCLMFTGCASYSVYKASEQQVYAKKIAKTKQNAVKAFADGETKTVGIGIDVLAWEAIMENPGKQLGAAILDAAVLYGAYEGVQYLRDSSSETKTTIYNINITDDHNNVVIVDDSHDVNTETEQSNSNE